MIDLTDSSRRRIGNLFLGTTLLMAVAEIGLSIREGELLGAAEIALLSTTFGFVLFHSLRAAPGNGAVWALIWAAFFGVSGQLGETIGFIETGFTVPEIEAGAVSAAPAQISTTAAIGFSLALAVWIPAVYLLANHVLILFPHGSAPSPIWRRVAWAAGVSMAVMTLASWLGTAPWIDRSYAEIYGSDFGPAGVASLLMVGLMATALAAIVNLIRRFWRSTGEDRLQYRWVTLALGLHVVSIFTFGLWSDPWGGVVSAVSLAAIPLSFGIAITKYRLYDIDLVISRTLVFGALVGFITLVYAALVVGLGTLVGGSSLGWSIAATAVVAVVFEPVRNLVQRWINRLVYGRRATPYEVLSDLTGRLAATEREEGLLERMASRIAEGTGAQRAVVWVAEGDGLRAVAAEPADELPDVSVNTVDDLPGSAVPIRSDDTLLGAFSVETRRGDELTPIERRLVDDLAGSASLLMQRLRLDAALRTAARSLAESRRRLLDAQDVERRRLERELNEGAQQQVVALKLQLGLAAQQAEREGADQAAALVSQMAGEAQDAIDQIQALAHGIYPPLLEAEGLGPAIAALAEVAPGEVTVAADLDGRFVLSVEGAVYLCIAEALTNAVKHGEQPIRIELSHSEGELSFRVTDSGPGFDSAAVRPGSGLRNMSDRVDALGGDLTVTSSTGSPTVVEGTVPATADQAALQPA